MDIEAIAKQTVSGHLECPVTELRAEDKSHGYPWFDEHKVVWVSDAELYIRACLVTAGGEGLFFAEPWDLERLNQLLRGEDLELPAGLAADEASRCLRDLLRGPGGFVSTTAALGTERPGLTCWIRPEHDPESEKALFERCFRDPVVSRDGDGWTLDFLYFTREGGVERWKVNGDQGGVSEVEVKHTVADGRFRYPYM